MPDEITTDPITPESEPQIESILPPLEVPEPQTAQIPVSESLPTLRVN